jgi:RsiW-degrading membrane proteinase PrsW (M82 family)
MGYLTLAISMAIGLLCIRKIRSYDIHEPEPVGAMMLVAVYGGLISVSVSSLGYLLSRFLGLRDYSGWLIFMLLVGPLEETAKYLGLLGTRKFYGRNLGEPVDGLIYMAAVALGFSLIENFMYANTGNSRDHLVFIRAVMSTPAHILFSLPLGLTAYLSAKKRSRPGYFWGALLLSSALHGIYDVLCTRTLLLPLALLAVLWMQGVILFRYLASRSPFRKSLKEFIASPETSKGIGETGIPCLHCGDDSPKQEIREEELRFQECPDCGRYVLTRDDAFRLFHRFAPEFRSLGREYMASPSHPGFHALYGCILIDDGRKIGYFEAGEVDAKLGEINARILGNSEGKHLVRWVSRLLGPEDAESGGAEKAARKGGAKSGAATTARESVLFAVGLALAVAVGVLYLRYSDSSLPGWQHKWKGKHIALTVPQGWLFSSSYEKHDRVESVSLNMKHRSWITMKFRCWEILPEKSVQKALKDFEEKNPHPRLRTDTLAEWGGRKGYGNAVTFDAGLGQLMYVTTFALSGEGHSLVLMEYVHTAYLESLWPQIISIRNSLEFVSDCDGGSEAPLQLDSADTRELQELFGGKGKGESR